MTREEAMQEELRISDAARLLRTQPHALKRLIHQKRLGAHQHGNGYWYTTVADVLDYLNQRDAAGVRIAPLRADVERYITQLVQKEDAANDQLAHAS